MGSPTKILTVPEFAALFNVNLRWLYRALQHGAIPCIRIGRAIRIDRDEALASLRTSSAVEER